MYHVCSIKIRIRILQPPMVQANLLQDYLNQSTTFEEEVEDELVMWEILHHKSNACYKQIMCGVVLKLRRFKLFSLL